MLVNLCNFVQNSIFFQESWNEICRFRNGLEKMEYYSTYRLPFVYKTVVYFAVYSYLAISVVAEQDIGETHIKLWFPLFGFLKVIFFVGWLKVALALEKPLERDVNLAQILNRHQIVCKVLIEDGNDEAFQI